MRPRMLVCVLFLAASAHGGAGQAATNNTQKSVPTAASFPAVPARWWGHMQALAADDTEGREPGTPGYERAASYVEQQFRAIGLTPAGTKGFRQQVSLVSRLLDEKETSLSLVRGDRVRRLDPATEAYVTPTTDQVASGEFPLVFVGHGLTLPQLGIRDLEGVNLKGKVAVLMAGAPKRALGPLGSQAQHFEERWRALRAAGAVGAVTLETPRRLQELPWDRQAEVRHATDLDLADPDLNASGGLRSGAIYVNPAAAEPWFEGSGHTFAELLADADADRPLAHFPLAASLRVTSRHTVKIISSDNLIAVLRGADPSLREQYVVLSAHLDGLGVGAPVKGDRIYNGALDNISGVATVLELAARLKAGPPLRRSVLFLLPTGEEQGLLGSYYFTRKPTVPTKAMVADINFDILHVYMPWKSYVGLGAEESSLEDDVRAVARARGVTVVPDPHPEADLFVRSDQYSFVKAGIPAVFGNVGFVPGSAEDRLLTDWQRERYHAPSDDLGQPMDGNTVGAFNDFTEALLRRIADTAAPPTWKPTSRFRPSVDPPGQ